MERESDVGVDIGAANEEVGMGAETVLARALLEEVELEPEMGAPSGEREEGSGMGMETFLLALSPELVLVPAAEAAEAEPGMGGCCSSSALRFAMDEAVGIYGRRMKRKAQNVVRCVCVCVCAYSPWPSLPCVRPALPSTNVRLRFFSDKQRADQLASDRRCLRDAVQ